MPIRTTGPGEIFQTFKTPLCALLAVPGQRLAPSGRRVGLGEGENTLVRTKSSFALDFCVSPAMPCDDNPLVLVKFLFLLLFVVVFVLNDVLYKLQTAMYKPFYGT